MGTSLSDHRKSIDDASKGLFEPEKKKKKKQKKAKSVVNKDGTIKTSWRRP
jgi:hypothetical protein